MLTDDFNDDMHKLIVDRLKERNRKMEIIKDFEKPLNKRTLSIASFVAAACLLGGIILISVNQTQENIDVPIRSSMHNVQILIDENRFEEALSIVEKELKSTDSTLNELKNLHNINDEEVLYEIKAQELKLQDLTKERDALKKNIK